MSCGKDCDRVKGTTSAAGAPPATAKAVHGEGRGGPDRCPDCGHYLRKDGGCTWCERTSAGDSLITVSHISYRQRLRVWIGDIHTSNPVPEYTAYWVGPPGAETRIVLTEQQKDLYEQYCAQRGLEDQAFEQALQTARLRAADEQLHTLSGSASSPLDGQSVVPVGSGLPAGDHAPDPTGPLARCYQTMPGERAVDPDYRPPDSFEHGVEAQVASISPASDDGRSVDVYESRYPSRSFRLSVAPRQSSLETAEPGYQVRAGGSPATVFALARAIATGQTLYGPDSTGYKPAGSPQHTPSWEKMPWAGPGQATHFGEGFLRRLPARIDGQAIELYAVPEPAPGFAINVQPSTDHRGRPKPAYTIRLNDGQGMSDLASWLASNIAEGMVVFERAAGE